MQREHHYKANIIWTGNTGYGTKDYLSYDRSYLVRIENKPDFHCSSDPAFRGDRTKYNPEELLLASLSSCHMLWYLHLCSDAGVVVKSYSDNATGIMVETSSRAGKFESVTLNPFVLIADDSKKDFAISLHNRANEMCFIANSVNFRVYHIPTVTIEAG